MHVRNLLVYYVQTSLYLFRVDYKTAICCRRSTSFTASLPCYLTSHIQLRDEMHFWYIPSLVAFTRYVAQISAWMKWNVIDWGWVLFVCNYEFCLLFKPAEIYKTDFFSHQSLTKRYIYLYILYYLGLLFDRYTTHIKGPTLDVYF